MRNANRREQLRALMLEARCHEDLKVLIATATDVVRRDVMIEGITFFEKVGVPAEDVLSLAKELELIP